MDANRKLKHIRVVIAILSISTILFCTTISLALSINKDIQNKKNISRIVLENHVDKLTKNISNELTLLSSIAIHTELHNGVCADFYDQAKSLFYDYSITKSIQLAPNGIITHVFPIVENKEALYINLFTDERRKKSTLEAYNNESTFISSPVELKQGGVGIIAMKPIYLEREGERSFWGFVVQVIDFHALLESINVQGLLDTDYLFSIAVVENGSTKYVYGEGNTSDESIVKTVNIYGTDWIFTLIPSIGWIDLSKVISTLLYIFIFFVLIILLYRYVVNSFRLNKELDRAANTDYVTSLYNRNRFFEDLAYLKSKDIRFNLYIIDLDRFKIVNDLHGHIVGDTILRLLAERINSFLPKCSTLYRIGGDEFSIIELSDDINESLKPKLFDLLSKPYIINDKQIYMFASCGCASYPTDSSKIDLLIKIADTRMYDEKKLRKGLINLNVKDFYIKAKRIINDSKANGINNKFSVFQIDFVGFRHINQIYGIEKGDELLQSFCRFIKSQEEVVLCERIIADQILFLTAAPIDRPRDYKLFRFWESVNAFIHEEQKNYPRWKIAVWCGLKSVEGDDVESAVEFAHAARLNAKKLSVKNSTVIDEVENLKLSKRSDLDDEILSSISENRITYYLQPQVDTQTGRIISAEALARIYTKSGEIIMPGTFLPVIEDSIDIMRFDMSILELVCKDLKDRIDSKLPIIPISINLSRKHLSTPLVCVDMIKSITSKYNIPANLLCFEITENLQIEELNALKFIAKKFQELGFSISLDDFGSGYSDLRILKEVNVDEIKIDKSFLPTNQNSENSNSVNATISKMVAQLAKELSIRVVFEGVESKVDLEFVNNIGINNVQGFYFEKPKPASEIYNKI